jgi:hypothetical protein
MTFIHTPAKVVIAAARSRWIHSNNIASRPHGSPRTFVPFDFCAPRRHQSSAKSELRLHAGEKVASSAASRGQTTLIGQR